VRAPFDAEALHNRVAQIDATAESSDRIGCTVGVMQKAQDGGA
jgi:hypothetical protein